MDRSVKNGGEKRSSNLATTCTIRLRHVALFLTRRAATNRRHSRQITQLGASLGPVEEFGRSTGSGSHFSAHPGENFEVRSSPSGSKSPPNYSRLSTELMIDYESYQRASESREEPTRQHRQEAASGVHQRPSPPARGVADRESLIPDSAVDETEIGNEAALTGTIIGRKKLAFLDQRMGEMETRKGWTRNGDGGEDFSFVDNEEADGYPTEYIERIVKDFKHLLPLAGVDELIRIDPRFQDDIDQTALCQSEVRINFPRMLTDSEGSQRLVVNVDGFRQGFRFEVCQNPNGSCSHGSMLGYESVCKQQFVRRKMVAMDKNIVEPTVEWLDIPSNCCCYMKLQNTETRFGDKNTSDRVHGSRRRNHERD